MNTTSFIVADETLAKRGLPEVAFIDNHHDRSPGAAPVIAIKRGEDGYYPIFTPHTAADLNAARGVTKGQVEAMQIGSLVGWDAPGANPAAWTEDGRLKGRHDSEE